MILISRVDRSEDELMISLRMLSSKSSRLISSVETAFYALGCYVDTSAAGDGDGEIEGGVTADTLKIIQRNRKRKTDECILIIILLSTSYPHSRKK
jgi:hypothetical protein